MSAVRRDHEPVDLALVLIAVDLLRECPLGLDDLDRLIAPVPAVRSVAPTELLVPHPVRRMESECVVAGVLVVLAVGVLEGLVPGLSDEKRLAVLLGVDLELLFIAELELARTAAVGPDGSVGVAHFPLSWISRTRSESSR